MSLISSLQHTVYQMALNSRKRKVAAKAAAPFHFTKAKNIALLIDLSGNNAETSLRVAKEYAQKLRNLNKEVQILAYTDEATAPDAVGFDCLCKKDLNWALVPKGDFVERFLSTSFDLLIALYPQTSSPLDFMVAAANTSFRVGYFQEDKTNLFDLMVHNDKENLAKALEQMERYLNIINQN